MPPPGTARCGTFRTACRIRSARTASTAFQCSRAAESLAAGSVTGIYTQPLTVYTPKVELIFTINTTDGYIQPLSDCTMLVNTNIGVLHFQRT